ncbi:3-oxoacyl-[acyl-carrier-protein] synthase-3 [Natronocella acetinitrilica]|uniref:3-oxoacyl-[acyl-carrier-protein] synthase-3 n=1 Tax=Natronocella acetinitrilica TaxID=414046 RepID=A0AAE3KCF3_9GAMM|nr:iron-containing redox enzyme family protein [Natronocella acetinitrilica]MCP1675711.1 3-oxoacyl-[acyl-carrier-protein] synthase-3 [Natronocella acetinitrilica]
MKAEVTSELGQLCLRGLMRVWFDFERQLGRVPLIARLESGRFDRADYRQLLLHWRQQVIEGARWISRTASSFDRDFAAVRSEVISHAQEEHRDYEVLEQDYVAAGGDLSTLQQGRRNAGTEALHAFLMYRASQTNPVDMLGAMWIIEGLGQKMANDWAGRVEDATDSNGELTRFMRYHGANDDGHMEKLYALLDTLCRSQADVDAILRTARVTGRLYALQLEEVDHE